MIRSGALRLLSVTAPAILAAILGSAPPCSEADDRPDLAAASDHEDTQGLVFLGDGRPVFIRMKLDTGGRGFRSAWLDAVKELHGHLDRDGDGTLTRQEADRGGLPAMVRAATGDAVALPTAELDADPRDGKVSVEELAAVLRRALGPFRVQVDRLAVEKTDALFNQLDRDKDGRLSRAELRSAVASLRRFDLDDDEQISPDELDPFRNRMAARSVVDEIRRGRFTAVPPVIELSAEDPRSAPSGCSCGDTIRTSAKARSAATIGSRTTSSVSTPATSKRPTPTPTRLSIPRNCVDIWPRPRRTSN
jgi:hypothetical protein